MELARRRRFFAALSILLSLLTALALSEGLVRGLERSQAARSATHTHYQEAYQASAFRKDGLGDAGFFAPGFSGFVSDELGRPVEWVHNSLGFRSRRELTRSRPPGVLRILSLGDSFVAGHRLAQEDTVASQIEHWLDQQRGFHGAEVPIAAIEQPAIGLEYLERFGFSFEPQVVMLGITLGNDVAQVYFSLGEQGRYRLRLPGSEPAIELNPGVDHDAALATVRAQLIPQQFLSGAPGATPWNARQPEAAPANGLERRLHTIAFVRRWLADQRERQAPQAILSTWSEYAAPRLFDGNGLGLYLSPPPPEIERAYGLLFELLSAYQRECAARGIELILTVHAQRFQIQPRDWLATVEAYGLNPARFDLAAPNRRVAEFCREHGLTCLDPTAVMAERFGRDGLSLFMPRGDMHWNRRGSRLFFELIRDELGRALARP